MTPIYIPHLLNAIDRTRSLTFETFFDGLETLMPVKAKVSVRHGTTFLEVRGEAQTIVTLTCDRCLQQYNHRIAVNAQEIIWLEEPVIDESSGLTEYEVSPEDLVESLSPQGYFEPDTWIYEQVCLELPQKQVCDPQCQGLAVQELDEADQSVDHRWSALAALKQQLNLSDSTSTQN